MKGSSTREGQPHHERTHNSLRPERPLRSLDKGDGADANSFVGSPAPPSSTAVSSSSIPSSAVASLIQSAAKITLAGDDQNTTARRSGYFGEPDGSSKLFKDDEYDHHQQQQHSNNEQPSLASLKKETIPPMPDEQDRKRFVGCLAAVLTTMYEYDKNDDGVCEEATPKNMDDSHSGGCSFQDITAEMSCSFYEEGNQSFDTRGSEQYDIDTSNSSPTKRSFRNISKMTHMAQTRHRRRRHDVLSQFLAKAAELLQLDSGHSKCFIPMLNVLRDPSASKSKGRNRASKKRPRPRPSSEFEISYTSGMDFFVEQMDRIEHLRSFMDDLGPGAGIRCLSMFLLQHLLHNSKGYDARIRHAVKTLGVLVLLHDILLDIEAEGEHWQNTDGDTQQPNSKCPDLVQLAVRKFESLERFTACQLIELSKAQQEKRNETKRGGKPRLSSQKSTAASLSSRRSENPTDTASHQILRGLKIGGTAVAAGALFAITGGLAAPGIAAGIAAVAGTTAIATAAAALTSTAAVTTIFGVGGGGLVAYKMQRRTVGLTEFEFSKESHSSTCDEEGDGTPDAELFSTICVSGWLIDDCDFQRPWGVTPSHPPIEDLLELLERFYAVHRPSHIAKCRKILTSWKGEEAQLWQLLKQNYGSDPNHLFPLHRNARNVGALTHEQEEIAKLLFAELGCAVPKRHQSKGSNRTPRRSISRSHEDVCKNTTSLLDLPLPPAADELDYLPAEPSSDVLATYSTLTDTNENLREEVDSARLKHLATVWDYQATYGGELYTVRWESSLIHELCASVADLAADVVTGATTQLLRLTALSALLSAIAIPYALKSAANMIDGTWTLVVERSDAAGKELAQSLLFSSAGNRPVTLVGFSFGARVIYACLKELARYQEVWEDSQMHDTDNSKRKRPLLGRENTPEIGKDMREPASIVGDVILMGLPNHFSQLSWQACRQVVAGRLVNCFSQKDLILSLMFQIKKFGLKPVCGTCAVNVAGVEDVDVSDLVSGHQEYCFAAGDILERVRLGDPFASCEATQQVNSKNKAEDDIDDLI